MGMLVLLGVLCGAVSASTVGFNLDGIEFAAVPPFVNLARQSRPFGNTSTPWQGAPSGGVDPATGWPLSDFGFVSDATVVEGMAYGVHAVCGAQPAVKVLSGSLQNATWDAATGNFSAHLVMDRNSSSVITTWTGTGGGCRHLMILLPGFGLGDRDTLNPEFLKQLKPVAAQTGSHLRFMDWLGTNGNPNKVWADRPRVDWGPSFTWGPPVAPTCLPSGSCFTNVMDKDHPLFPGMALSSGVPVEVVIDVANTLNMAPWINVPWAACPNDTACTAYVTELATLLKSKLKSALPVYLELSNELWNPSFAQTHGQWYLANQSVLVDGDPHNLACLGSNVYQWAPRLTAHRLNVVGKAACAVFGESGACSKHRVRPVLAGQVMGTPQEQGLRYMLECANTDPRDVFFATANAPYFSLYPDASAGPTSKSCWSNLTKADVLSGLQQTLDTAMSPSTLQSNHANFVSIATFFRLPMVSYEGGPDTSCFFKQNSSTPAKIAAHLDPAMRGIISGYVANLGGFDPAYMLTYFVWGVGPWSQYGEWTLAPNASTLASSPKLAGLLDAMAAPPPPVSHGVAVPAAAITAIQSSGTHPPSDAAWTAHTNSSIAWVLRPSADTTFTISANITAHATTSLEVWTDAYTHVEVAIPGAQAGVMKLGAFAIAAPLSTLKFVAVGSLVVWDVAIE